MTDLPQPLVSSEVDLRGFSGFMLDVDRLLASELVALGRPDECWAAVMLWCRAWKQTPAGSLPDDDRVLAAFSGAGPRWPKVKVMALRGFMLCSDGRLYHRVLAEEVQAAWHKRKAYKADQERLKKWREGKRSNVSETPPKTEYETHDETAPETVVETRFKTVSETVREPEDRDRDRDRDKDSSLRSPRANGPRKIRVPRDWEPSSAGVSYAKERGLTPADLAAFRDLHIAKGNLFADIEAAWRTWCRNADKFGKSAPLLPVAPETSHLSGGF